jgi:hypothetical protein
MFMGVKCDDSSCDLFFLRVSFMRFRDLWSVVLLLTILTCAAHAQSRDPLDSISADKASPNADRSPLGSPEEEMMARREIKVAEKAHQENLARAAEAAQLASELQTSFAHNQSLGRDEFKKLDRLEKLTRRIRHEAGGSDDPEELKDAPNALEPALTRLAETSEALRKGVEKTPRQVVSALVIERANEVIEIIRSIHGMVH